MKKNQTDVVSQHARLMRAGKFLGTSHGCKVLHLQPVPQNYYASNTYATAIWLIVKLQNELRELANARGGEQ